MSDVSWEVLVRAEQPIVGCELSPHAYLKIKSAILDNPGKAKWSRGPVMQMCCAQSCTRKDSNDPLHWSSFARGGPRLRCAVCEKVGVPRHETLFCSMSCFQAAWPQHMASKHPFNTQATANTSLSTTSKLGSDVAAHNKSKEKDQESDGDGEEEIIVPEDPADEDVAYVEGHIPTSNMDDSHGGVGGVWEAISSEKTYLVTEADVGRILRIECEALLLDGSTLAGPVVVYTESVLCAPRLPPRRNLVAVPNAASSVSAQAQFRFRLVSYNILAEIYATKHAYPYCDPWSLKWPYRRSLVLQELLESQGDVICLQEVQADHYEQNLQPMLAEMGYDGLYKQKTRESMGQHGKVDGCAIFWKTSKFIMVENYSIEFNDIVKRHASQMGLEDSDLHRFISRLSKDNVAQVLVLEALTRPQQQQTQRSRTSNRICVVNTHLYSNHTRPELKLWQTVTLLQEIEHYILNQDLALCICGDFNSEPESAVYQYLANCRLDESNTKVEGDVLKCLATASARGLMHSIELESAMWRVFGYEPEFTNYTRNFKGTLDYIWYTPSRLKILAASAPPAEHEILGHSEGLPSVQHPSDHIHLCCDVSLLLASGGGSMAAHTHRTPSPAAHVGGKPPTMKPLGQHQQLGRR